MYNDILPNSGGTQIALDSVKVVADFFAQHPEGVHQGETDREFRGST
jgi:hypothetical protein